MRKLIVFVLTFCSMISLHAQVELQTGRAGFSMPIFNWQDDQSRLAVNIALEYNSGNGLRVNDIASSVGQGWNLAAGGVVTRMQVGEPDDQLANDGNNTIEDINKYPTGYLNNLKNASDGCPSGLYYYPIFGEPNHLYKNHNTLGADREQDYFSVQFNGRSAMFVLRKGADVGVSIGNSNLKIWFRRDNTTNAALHCRTTIYAFFIQDENGLVYTFSKLSLSKILRMHPATPALNGDIALTGAQNYQRNHVYYETMFDEIPLSYNPYVVTGWYLDNIFDPLTSRTVTFSYDTRNINSSSGDVIRMIDGSYMKVSHYISKSQTPAIKSIQYPDGHVVTFNYDTYNARPDLKGDYAMRSIDVKYKDRYQARYLLNMTYFLLNTYGMPITDAQKLQARLCLKSVTKIGPDLKESQSPYVFDYYTGSNATEDFVPPPFYYAKDIYGYYNGHKIDTKNPDVPAMPLMTTQLAGTMAYQAYISFTFEQFCSLVFYNLHVQPSGFNTVNPGFAKNGLLKSVTYPAGKMLTYEYEQNAYNRIVNATTMYVSTTPNDPTELYVGGVHVSKTAETDGGYSNGSANPIVTNYKYVKAGSTVTSQWGVEAPNNAAGINIRLTMAGGHNHIFNGCSFDYIYPGIQSADQAQNIMDNNANGVTVLKVLSYALMAYSWTMDIIAACSGNPAFIIFDVVMVLVDYLFTTCGTNTQFLSSGHQDNYDIFGNDPLPAQFSRVEVFQGSSPQDNGETVYEFTDYNDYALWETKPVPHLTVMNQRAAPWAYGLPKLISIYDKNGTMVRQTDNRYDFTNAKLPASTDYSCNCSATDVESLRADSWSTFSNAANMTYYAGTSSYGVRPALYQIYTGRVSLKDSYNRVMKQGSSTQYMETLTHYDYNPTNFQVSRVRTTQSDLDILNKEIYYTVDYNNASKVIEEMKYNNMVTNVVAVYTSLEKYQSSSPAVYLGANVTDYIMLASGMILPGRLYGSRAPQPVTNFSFNASNVFTYPNLTAQTTYYYNDNGLAIGQQDEGWRWVSNIYDYDSKFIVATTANADPYYDKAAYTSFETSSLGGWTSNGPASTSSTSITGDKALLLNPASSLTASLNTAKPYIVSFWASAGLSLNAGATLVKSGPTINGLTFYEYNVPQGASSVVITAGAAITIDELRAYPKMSRMRTSTYDPLVGKTSDCDENNRIVYYEYDNWGRMRFVKDENKNVVKMYEYSNKMNSNSIAPATPVAYTGPVYCKLSTEYIGIDAAGRASYRLVVNFYLDAASTIPVYVKDKFVSVDCANACGGYPTLHSAYTTTGSGTGFTVASGVNINYNTYNPADPINGTIQCTNTYTLNPGDYIPQ